MWKFMLAPVAALYKMGVSFRHALFDRGILKSERFKIPIICIGNITVGGTGKTPMAEMVISYMTQHHRVALLSRGYGRKTKGYIEVTCDAHYRKVGDEPLQIKQKFPDITVIVCEKRTEGIRRIMKEHPEVNLIIMDDGFQHRYVEPKVNIVMVDATRPIKEDKYLPQGSLRDLPEQLYRAQYFIVTKCPEPMVALNRSLLKKDLVKYAYQSIYFTRYETFGPQPIFKNDSAKRPRFDQQQEVIALSGIGNPGPFLRTLKERYKITEEVTLNDHHVYKVRDVNRLSHLLRQHPSAVVVTTEKDAVKLTNRNKIPQELRSKLYYLPINITFIGDSATDFLQKLESDVRGN